MTNQKRTRLFLLSATFAAFCCAAVSLTKHLHGYRPISLEILKLIVLSVVAIYIWKKDSDVQGIGEPPCLIYSRVTEILSVTRP